MPFSPTSTPDGAHLARELHARPGLGAAAHVLQGRGLQVLRVRLEQPALIFVDRGIKAVQPERGSAVKAHPGQALVLAGNQTVSFTNTLPDGGSHYEARWLLFDADLLSDAYYAQRAAKTRRHAARLLPHISPGLAAAFDRARQALCVPIPDPVARQRLLEAMHWLLEDGIALHCPPSGPAVAQRVRQLLHTQLAADWTAPHVARELAQSEATLRRRLAAEGTTLTELLTDARMSTALTLLQATARPVADIAHAVGYGSPSRFAVRFRQRFGFAPTAVRGHERYA